MNDTGTLYNANPLVKLGSVIQSYQVFACSAEKAVSACAAQERAVDGLKLVKIGCETVDLIESSRPRYSATALRYLDTGHCGYGIVDADGIVAMGWLYHNPGPRRQRVEYYPLDSGHFWLHADWTAPGFRGRGLHKWLIQERCWHAFRVDPHATIEANISPSNAPSIKNYVGFGFQQIGIAVRFSFRGANACLKIVDCRG